MRTPALAAHLQSEMLELQDCWEIGQSMLDAGCPEADVHQAMVYAGLMLAIPDGLERLRMGWVIDRSDREGSIAALKRCQNSPFARILHGPLER